MQLQAALPPDLAFSHAYPSLLAAALHPSSPREGGAGGGGADEKDRDVGLALAQHSPLRLCLLSDAKALHARLASPDAIRVAAAAVASAAALLPPSKLPALLVAELLLGGGATPPTSTRGRDCQPPSRSAEAAMRALLGSVVPSSRAGPSWLLLRLMLDNRTFVALSQV